MIHQAKNGNTTFAPDRKIPASTMTLDLCLEQWNSDRYDINIEYGPVTLYKKLYMFFKCHAYEHT